MRTRILVEAALISPRFRRCASLKVVVDVFQGGKSWGSKRHAQPLRITYSASRIFGGGHGPFGVAAFGAAGGSLSPRHRKGLSCMLLLITLGTYDPPPQKPFQTFLSTLKTIVTDRR